MWRSKGGGSIGIARSRPATLADAWDRERDRLDSRYVRRSAFFGERFAKQCCVLSVFSSLSREARLL